MSTVLYPFILSTIAGLSTMLGSVLLFVKFKKKNKIINYTLAFSGSVMASMSFINLIPESINFIDDYFFSLPCFLIVIFFIGSGTLLAALIDKTFVIKSNDHLYRLGILMILVIIMHNIPEGIATYLTSVNNKELGFKITIAIALHNIPEGISILIPIYYSTKSRKKALLYTFISGIAEPFGALLAYLFLYPIVNNLIIGIIFSIIAGIMLHIALKDLIIEAFKDKSLGTYLSMLIGFILVIITSLF